MMRKVS